MPTDLREQRVERLSKTRLEALSRKRNDRNRRKELVQRDESA